MSKVLQRLTDGQGRRRDVDDLIHIAHNIQGRTICAFGEACAWPVLSFVQKFRDEFERRGVIAENPPTAGGTGPASGATRLAAGPPRA
jgi:NADH-quinone oxidoreductase subunit F